MSHIHPTAIVEAGAKLVATNLDPNCPTQHGLRPGCGAIVAMLEAATGKKAFSLGKPSPIMMRAARLELGLSAEETRQWITGIEDQVSLAAINGPTSVTISGAKYAGLPTITLESKRPVRKSSQKVA